MYSLKINNSDALAFAGVFFYVGYFLAQYFPRAEEIKICVSDFGVGIPTSLRKKISGFI